MATRDEASACKRDKVEQYLSCAGSMTASTWCRLNHVKSSTFYEWLAHFRDTEPEMFGGYEIAHAGDGKRRWFEEVRKAMAASRAIARPAPAKPASFAIVDAADLAGAPEPEPRAASCAGAITLSVCGAVLTIPSGTCEGDISAVLRAVRSL